MGRLKACQKPLFELVVTTLNNQVNGLSAGRIEKATL